MWIEKARAAPLAIRYLPFTSDLIFSLTRLRATSAALPQGPEKKC